ncbi:hypothetical protein L1049_013219 [Liquidambar formosana]|uniref:DUF4283 domain-containing protein n=1 Tax=Liquidambar formosana TaxID=63359 RepID=A0AAP0RKU9_LIQFO
MDDSLASMWKNFVLTEEEKVNVEVTGSMQGTSTERAKFYLVGKLLTDRLYNAEALKSTLKMIWKLVKGLTLVDLGKNLFLFQFYYPLDRRRVLDTGPWSFDKSLVLLKEVEGDVQPSELVIDKATFWVQVDNLPLGCMTKDVG